MTNATLTAAASRAHCYIRLEHARDEKWLGEGGRSSAGKRFHDDRNSRVQSGPIPKIPSQRHEAYVATDDRAAEAR